VLYFAGDAATVQVGTTYYFPNSDFPPFTPTQPGVFAFRKVANNTSYYYLVSAYSPPQPVVSCALKDSNGTSAFAGFSPFVLQITDTSVQLTAEDVPPVKVDKVEAYDDRGVDISQNVVVSQPTFTAERGRYNVTVSGITSDSSIFFTVSNLAGKKAVCCAKIHYPVYHSAFSSSINFTAPTNGQQVSNLSNIVVQVATQAGSGGYFTPGVYSFPPLRLTAPYVSIRRPDGKYWSGAPQRAWLPSETLLQTQRRLVSPNPSALFPTYSYELQDVPPFSQVAPGSYTLTAYDRAVGGDFPTVLVPISASIKVNVSG